LHCSRPPGVYSLTPQHSSGLSSVLPLSLSVLLTLLTSFEPFLSPPSSPSKSVLFLKAFFFFLKGHLARSAGKALIFFKKVNFGFFQNPPRATHYLTYSTPPRQRSSAGLVPTHPPTTRAAPAERDVRKGPRPKMSQSPTLRTAAVVPAPASVQEAGFNNLSPG